MAVRTPPGDTRGAHSLLMDGPDTTAEATSARIAPQDILRAARTLPASDPLRARMEAAVRRLETLAAEIIAELDKLTGDPDSEPSLGFSDPRDIRARNGLDQRKIAEGATDDREDEHDGSEPSLGAGERPFPACQERWGLESNDGDLEGDDKCDREPSLGSLEMPVHCRGGDPLDQSRWGSSGSQDIEQQCEDEGGACEDEGHDSDIEQDWDSDAPAPGDDAVLRAYIRDEPLEQVKAEDRARFGGMGWIPPESEIRPPR